MDSPLSLTSSIISILTFIITILIWLGQQLDRAIKLDDEIATTGLMLIRSCGETTEVQSLSTSKNTKMGKQLEEMWILDLESIRALVRILRLSAADRFLQWGRAQEIIRDNSKEVKKLRAGMNFVTIFVLPEQIEQVQTTLVESVNVRNEMLVAKLDSLRVTHQDEELRGGAPEDQDDGASMRSMADLLVAQSESRPEVPAAAEKQPEERPEAPSEKQSNRQSNEHSRPHSKSSSSSPNPPTPPFGGIPPNEGSSQQASSIPAFFGRPLNEQHSQLQSQSQSQSSLQTQIQAEREALTKALAHFMREEKIQPSQLSSLVLLLALFFLGSRGLATKSSIGAQEGKKQGQGEQEEMEHGELERSGDRFTHRNQRRIRNAQQSRFNTEW